MEVLLCPPACSCPQGTACTNGDCLCIQGEPGGCDGTCVDMDTDKRNCGGCGVVYVDTHTCFFVHLYKFTWGCRSNCTTTAPSPASNPNKFHFTENHCQMSLHLCHFILCYAVGFHKHEILSCFSYCVYHAGESKQHCTASVDGNAAMFAGVQVKRTAITALVSA
jgi:hypothetical protein